jgi:hypothetical protein
LTIEFELKNLCILKYFLEIKVSPSHKEIFLCKKKYTLDLLQETSMLAYQLVDTLVEESLKLYVEFNQILTNKGRYQRLVGRLVYLAHTRSDLAYALSIINQFMHNSEEKYMNVIIHILRYLKATSRKRILFIKNTNVKI